MRIKIVSRTAVLLLAVLIFELMQISEIRLSLMRNWIALRAVQLMSADEFTHIVFHDSFGPIDQSFDVELGSWPIRRLLGTIYLRNRNIQDALSILIPASKSKTRLDPLTRFFQGQAMYLAGRTDEALAIWRTIPQLDVYFAFQGDSAYVRNEQDEALQFYQLSWRLASTNTAAKHNMLLNLCRYHRGNGQLEQALQWCQRARDVSDDYWTLSEIGRTYYEAGQYELAENVLRQAMDKLPDQGAAYQWLGLTLYNSGRVKEGIQMLSKSARLNPSSVWPRLELANLYLREKNYSAAACQYLQALSLTQDSSLREAIQDKLKGIGAETANLDGCDISKSEEP